MAVAVISPTRRPVNGPGPSPATIAPSAAGVAPTWPRQSWIEGARRSAWARASTVTRSLSSAGGPAPPTSTRPAVTAAEDVSIANTSIRRQ